MLPKLKRFDLGFKKTSADTYICDRKHLVSGVSLGFTIDYDVVLSNGECLQRPLVWTPAQKSEWIWSLIYERPIPPVAVHKTDKTSNTYEIIDGKQRMHTIGEFLRDEFPLIYENDEYLFSELTKEYKDRILYGRPVLGYTAYDLSEIDKIRWFKWINYAGTPQDQSHIQKIEKLLSEES